MREKDSPIVEEENDMMSDQIDKEKVDENYYAEKKKNAIGKKKKQDLETINFVRSDSEESDSDEPEEEPLARLSTKCSQNSSQNSIPPRDKKGLSSRVVGSPSDEAFEYSTGKKKISKRRRKALSLCVDKIQQKTLNQMNSFYEDLDEEELTFA